MNQRTDFLDRLFDRPFLSLESTVLNNALTLGIFEKMGTEVTGKALAEENDWDEENTKIFLQTLHALGYLECTGENFVNTENTEKYLRKESPYYIGAFLFSFDGYITASFPKDVTNLIKNGPEKSEETQAMDLDFAAMMETLRAYQSGYPRQQFIDILREYKEYKGAKKILDLGCGVGEIGIGLAKDVADSEVYLYDLPAMEEAIKETAAKEKMEKRVHVMAGDFSVDPIGTGYDVIFSSNAVYAAKGDMDGFMKKIYDSLNDEGIFVCVSDGVEEDFCKPWDMVTSWMVYRMQRMDLSVPKDLVAKAGVNAGLSVISKESKKLMGGHMDIDVLKKKK